MRARGEVFETPPDAPTYELPEWFWKNAYVVRVGEGRTVSVHLRVDRYVLEWFKRQGKGHLTRMNAVLRAYYEAHRDRSAKLLAKTRQQKKSTRL